MCKNKPMVKALLLLFLSMTSIYTARAYDFSASASSGQVLYYNILSDSTVAVTYPNHVLSSYYSGFQKPTGSLAIPASVSYGGTTYQVVSVGDNAFNSCAGLTVVTIPNTVTSIGDYAFSYNKRITSIVIPNRVTRVGHDAFYYCSSLQEVTIGESVTLLDQYSFYECQALETVNIQSKVLEVIDNNSFHHCVSLTSIKIPDSVERIGGFAFQDCSSLQEVGLGSGVSRIDICAFADTDALEDFYYAGSMSDWASISKGSHIFSGSSLTSISCSDGDVSVNA